MTLRADDILEGPEPVATVIEDRVQDQAYVALVRIGGQLPKLIQRPGG